MCAAKKTAQIREYLISESAWEEMTCLFAPSLVFLSVFLGLIAILSAIKNGSDELAVFLITLSAWFAALSKFYSLKLYKNS